MRLLSASLVLPLVCALASTGQQQDAQPWSSVAREQWVRSHARAPLEAWAELDSALGDDRWPRRAAALEALRRAWEIGTLGPEAALPRGLLERVAAIASDPAAPERSLALAALATAPRPPELGPAALDTAVDGPPAVALALTRLLERVPAGVALPRLERLAGHLDERVAAAALGALAARADGSQPLAAAVAPLARQESGAAFVAGLERLERCGASAAALDELARRLAADAELGQGRRAAALSGVEAVRLVVHGEADVGLLVEGWSTPDAAPLSRQALMLRAARAARAAEVPLCAALLDVAPRGEDPRVALEGAVEAASAETVLALAEERPGYAGALGETLWSLLAGRVERWDPARVAPWLAPQRDPQLRAAVADALSVALAASGDEASARLLAGLLADADHDLGLLAFRSLCALADPGPWLAELHAAWAALPRAERVQRLRWLPRDRPLEPFREDLAQLGEGELQARAPCAELLGPWRGERAVAERLARWLREDLARLEESGGRDAQAEGRAVALVRALGGAGLADAELELLLEVVARADEGTLAVAKTTVAVLAQLPGAELTVQPLLWDPHRPSRLRIEAALQLAPTGMPRALEVLDESYDGCDAVLKARAVRAAAAQPDAPTIAFLRRVAFDPAQASELRGLAVDGLAAHGQLDLLLALLAIERHPDVRAVAVAGLGTVGDELARAALLELLGQVEDGTRPASPEERAAEREGVLLALAACGAWSPGLRARWLARPLATADDDLAARLRGERLAPPPFRFRGELALAASRAARGALAEALAAAGAWWRVDGRLLGHLGADALEREPLTAARVLEAAWIALAGEADGEDGGELRFELRRRLLAAAEARRAWDRVAALCDGLLADWRAGRVPQRPFEALFGALDPAAGIDPRARLESAALQARAWQAHEAGEAARARALAADARARLGASSDALRAQQALEEALGPR